ncbi:WcbI family polysaccharide biosynthesis putative acetyltransferase [Acidisphaera rubrifaciens]|uniref:Polysaccharide biosynthesis enzyme WcbI domain-containing protein n=1 Tax=Acidisphaera rubrifaciens HS-AP3 TaxID=1231350 RepID=A0A0D6P9W5_9PROT|nr:WcbI family polysaccharide biosynthesis putative acetyltransferase [Acidisphaera rubrifaciens]GAN77998.1 hypothetical protein Asru_0565_03 [Acidisphaera rubrifaciens HS-AP3]
MPRLIAFFGNCQSGSLCTLYERCVVPITGDRVAYIASYSDLDSSGADTVASADILVNQVLDFAPDPRQVSASTRVVLVPHVAAPFLWPCSGTPHPSNSPAPYLDPSGPYDAELGDSFLNKLIAQNVPPELAVFEYLAADIPRLRQVDRMREIALDRQRMRDQACGGYGVADLIDSRIASEKLFCTVNHPERMLALRLAAEVFERIGVPGECLDAVEAYTDRLFPPNEAPIHPAVARHFGLSYADANTRYRFFDEGRFTFTEYAHRYMNYAWNPDLPFGMHLAREGQHEQAIEVLQRAVEASPGSAAGRAVLADLLADRGEIAEAAKLAKRAAELEPTDAHINARAAHIHKLWAQAIQQ